MLMLASLLVMASLAWAFASVWMQRLEMPPGAMSAATQMLLAGLQLGALSLLHGDQLQQWPSHSAWGALLYLALFGSILAYSAFFYLLRNVRPALASSYAYVNPPIAVLLGWGFAGEQIGRSDFAGAMQRQMQSLPGLFSNLGVINGWTPAVAALTPSAVFLVAAMVMMWWVERR